MSRKTGFIILAGIWLITAASCNKIKEAIFPTINIDLPAFQFTVPPIPFVLGSEASLGSFTMHFNLDSIVRAKTAGVFGAGAVSTVKVNKIIISLNNGDEANNLANFESARFAFSSNTKTNPVEIAAFTFTDTFSTNAIITPANSPELKEYLNGTELTYTLYGKARRITTKPLSFNVLVTIGAK